MRLPVAEVELHLPTPVPDISWINLETAFCQKEKKRVVR